MNLTTGSPEPSAARVADYFYGGQNNFEADRRAARALDPEVEEAARQWNKLMPAQPVTLRSRAGVARLAAAWSRSSPAWSR